MQRNMSGAQLTKSFVYNGATVTVRRADVRARLRTSLVYNKLGLPEDAGEEWLFMQNFARFVTQTDVEGDLGFAIPSLSDDDDTFRAGYEAFLSADGEFFELFQQVYLEIHRSGGETDAKKKTTSAEA